MDSENKEILQIETIENLKLEEEEGNLNIESIELNNDKHKQIPSCLNNCISWKLKAEIKNEKSKNEIIKEYEFNGKSLFFKKLEASILNILQNNTSNYNTNFLKENCLNQLEIESKNQLNVNKLKESSLNVSIKDFLNINFPIDNSEFNFMIIDANLGVIENLNNIFFLEFDLTNGNNNNNIDLRCLNDECVENEIFFNLNGTIHDTQIFKNDLLFSVEYRKFIKSIQFRLKNFKNSSYDDKRKNWKRKKNNNNHMKDNLTFFAKILSNINIGIEFTRPFSGDYEILHTNFNSVVNSNIKLNKIYLELCIPKMFINNKINLSSVLNKNDKLEKEKNDGATSDTSNQSNKITSPLINNNNNNENSQNKLNNNNYIYNNIPPLNIKISSPQKIYQNDFERMLFNQHNSPPSIRDKFNMGKYVKYNNFYNSPNIYLNNNNNSPNSMGNYVHNNINSPGIGSPIIYTPLSPMMQNPYLINFSNIQNNNNNSNNRKFSENIYQKLKENPLSKMNRIINYNNNSQKTPVIMRVNPEEMIRSIPVLPFISPQEKIINNNNNNRNFYSMTPMIQTIHKRILDWENKNTNTSNINIDNKNEFNNMKLEPVQIVNSLKNEFLNLYDGKNNLDIFINSITPFIPKENSDYFFKMKLFTYFKFFTYISLFELKNTYYLYGYLVNINYSISLDSINIVISKENIIEKIINFLISINKIKSKEEIKEDEEIILNDLIPNLIIRFNSNKIIISFNENKPWHLRQIFINEIKEIIKIIPILQEIKIEEIEINESYFSILYYPTKANRPYMKFTSFLVYYRFNKEIDLNNEKYDKCLIMGILPIKFDPKLYLTKISINGFLTIPIPPFMPFMPIYNQDTILLKNLINGVTDNLKNIKHTSFDYDYYMKTSNYNQIFK